MEWATTLSIIFTVIGTGYYVLWDIHGEIRSMNARTDKLYEMFIDLLKEKK